MREYEYINGAHYIISNYAMCVMGIIFSIFIIILVVGIARRVIQEYNEYNKLYDKMSHKRKR